MYMYHSILVYNFNFTIEFVFLRCHVADILFEGGEGDVSLPISLVESLLLVCYLHLLYHEQCHSYMYLYVLVYTVSN